MVLPPRNIMFERGQQFNTVSCISFGSIDEENEDEFCSVIISKDATSEGSSVSPTTSLPSDTSPPLRRHGTSSGIKTTKKSKTMRKGKRRGRICPASILSLTVEGRQQDVAVDKPPQSPCRSTSPTTRRYQSPGRRHDDDDNNKKYWLRNHFVELTKNQFSCSVHHMAGAVTSKTTQNEDREKAGSDVARKSFSTFSELDVEDKH